MIPSLDIFNPYITRKKKLESSDNLDKYNSDEEITEKKEKKANVDVDRPPKLEALLYSDTSSTIQQLFLQHHLKYKAGMKDQHDLNTMRAMIVYSIVCANSTQADGSFDNMRLGLASMDQSHIFDAYKDIATAAENVANHPTNKLLLEDFRSSLSKVKKKLIDMSFRSEDTDQQLLSVLKNKHFLLNENVLRHWLYCLNDYSRRDQQVITSGMDEDLVWIELQKYIKQKLTFYEDMARKTVKEIHNDRAAVIMRFLNTPVIEEKESDKVDNFLNYMSPFKFVVYGGTNTFHEFLQYLIISIDKFPEFSLHNLCRIYTLPTSDSAIGYYLSKKDNWYQKNIFMPFAINPLTPILNKNSVYDSKYKMRRNIDLDVDSVLKDFNVKKLLPIELLERQLQLYLSEASRFIKMYLYSVECRGM